MAKQYGFYYDSDRCIQCRTCEVACKSTHNLEPGVKWRQVTDTWQSEYPDVTRMFLSLACMHCQKPACMAACPEGAIVKRTEDGIVVVDRDRCSGCRDCFSACPSGIPQFGKDGTMQKCDFCIEAGLEPVCAVHCPAEAIHYGTIEELAVLASEKGAHRLSGSTQPSVFIREPKK